MSDLLAEMAAASRARAQAVRSAAGGSLGALRERAMKGPPVKPLRLDGFAIIAEVKRVSPAEGVLSRDEDAVAFAVRQAERYAAGGAAAISVLTEPARFGGDLSHAAAAARAVDVPVMRKDFLVDPAQVYEARLAGCSGVLLIARMLNDQQLVGMLTAAAQCGLFVLLEAFDQRDLARAGQALSDLAVAKRDPGSAPVLLGVNTRDLSTLATNPGALESLVPRTPAGYPRIAESGLTTPEDAAHAARLGYHGALVGTALMRAGDPASLIASMRAAANAARPAEARA